MNSLVEYFLRHYNAVCEKCKSFAKIANRLQKSQTALESPKTVRWSKQQSVQVAQVHRLKLHVLYSKKLNTWMWQLGNEFFYERATSVSEEQSKQQVIALATDYSRWDMMHSSDMEIASISWRTSNQDWFGHWRAFEFWISPLDDTQRLWRYDIYRGTDVKSVRSGVARSLHLAKRASIRSATFVDDN